MNTPVLQDKIFVAIASAAFGVLATLVAQGLLSRRGTFSYHVNHARIGVSADDEIFGKVRVTWNDTEVGNLYASTITLKNESMSDYENVMIRAFSSDTTLLTERTSLEGTTQILQWAPDYAAKLEVPAGSEITQAQFDLHSRRRDYLVPVLNRGQTIRLEFLNAAKTPEQPSIWLDVQHKGVKTKFRMPQRETYGVASPLAALAGLTLSFFVLSLVVLFVPSVPIAAAISMGFGLFAAFPGAAAIRLWRAARDWLFG